MTTSMAVWLVVGLAFVAANLPWLNERLFFAFRPKGGEKAPWQRWLEWLALYFVMGALAIGVERRLTGEWFSQDWEFYAVTWCLFLVFALPGFIWRHDLRHHLARR
jgi:hypothetical protein